jgi:hypothetical protein
VSVTPYLKYLRTLPAVCATTLAGNLEFAFYFLQEVVHFKVYGVYGAAFLNISLAINKIVSTLRLMKQYSDVNIPDFKKGTASYFAVCDNNTQCITPWRTIKHYFQIITDP